MDEPRLKSHIRIAAHLRRATAGGAFAAIARRGDADAGAIMVKVFVGSGEALLFTQTRDLDGALVWHQPLSGQCAEKDVDRWIAKEAAIDPDFWVIEIEDRDGRPFLEDW